ncbi:hypothetical protein [Paracoccus sp. SCSIO 75233]|uniref:hypothetical protein n=1 Tax=Paracoccus sp. SCSIO 75233 TaxID=3017782 RepID=UPI0022F07E91|nr:hypothetical protein [Paracoccus sp. SCSIO 75233]WBU53597.1 hypothetical protein PAF12_01795 [Paracoccus sp. SCSIO 75233]
MKPLFRFGVIGLIASAPTASFSYCSEPSVYASEPSFSGYEPSAPSSFQKPDVPYCLSSYSYSGTHDCDEYELNAYFDEVEEYVEDLEDYYEEALIFAQEAIDYANEALAFSNDIQQFADEVLDYANCEAEDVTTQHE